MKVLVTAASKYESTKEIGEAIAGALRDRGLEVDVLPPPDVASVRAYDAVVLGSAVYAGHWMKEARELATREGSELATRPVWLFSSGPIGDPPKPDGDPADITPVVQLTKAREHRVFAGRLERKRLNFGEKAMVTALRAKDGDFRDWSAIEAWGNSIADALTGATPTA